VGREEGGVPARCEKEIGHSPGIIDAGAGSGEAGMKISIKRSMFLCCINTVLLCSLTASYADPAKRSESVSKTNGLSDSCPSVIKKDECLAILNALRKRLGLTGSDLVFETQYLRIEGGWAWIRVTPRSGDGLHVYEDHSALMRKTQGRWGLAELRSGECAWDPDCWDDERYFRKLRLRFPDAPKGIFPRHK